jgi:predicted dehydrogenase
MGGRRAPLRVGVLGCGLMGGRRAAAALAAGDQVVAVADTGSAAARLAPRCGAEVVRGIPGLLAAGCDAVVVATPHAALAPSACELVAGGCHVMVEKPGGTRAAELVALLARARAANRHISVAYSLRHTPAVEALVAVTPALGRLLHLRAVYGHGGRPGMEAEWRCDAALGGGELLDQGVHLLDLALLLLGPVTRVAGRLRTAAWGSAVEDNAFLLLDAGEGVAVLHASWTEWRNTFRVDLVGSAGSAHLQGLSGHYGPPSLLLRRCARRGEPPAEQVVAVPAGEPWPGEWAEFAACCRAPGASYAGLERAIAILRVVEEVHAVSRDGR